MPCYGATRNPSWNRESKSGVVHIVGPHHDRHDLRVQPDTAGKDLSEIFPPPKPLLRSEPSIGRLAFRRRVFVVPSHVVR